MNKEVPESMKNKRVISLDISSLLSGAMFRGQFEERLKAVLKDIQGESILSIFASFVSRRMITGT